MNNKQKVNEMIEFLKFSFKNKNKNISILFELFDHDIKKITKVISIRIKNDKLVITDKKEKESSKMMTKSYDTEIKLKTETFIKLYSGNLSAFNLFKLLLKSDDIETKNCSIKKFRSFISHYDFSSSKWKMFYLKIDT